MTTSSMVYKAGVGIGVFCVTKGMLAHSLSSAVDMVNESYYLAQRIG